MGSGHGHGPGALTATGRHRGRLGAVLAITVGIAVAEVCGALVSGSLVLLADAAHMAADAAGVGLSLLAAYVAARPASIRMNTAMPSSSSALTVAARISARAYPNVHRSEAGRAAT